jgi:hypothetical protein
VVRAVHALGGPDALRAVKAISMKGTVKQWEPEQSVKPGGDMRFANEATFDTVTDVTSGFTRTDWVRKFAYPAPRTFTFTEIVTTDVGYVSGIDSNGRTRQSLDSNPPAHTMSGLRLAAAQREQRRASALLLLEMYRNPAGVYAVPDVNVGGVSYRAVEYRAGGQSLLVMFDGATGLPARIRSLDYDNIWGDVTYDAVLSDWQTVSGVKVAATRKYELNGRMVSEVKVTETRINAPVDTARFGIPAAYIAGAPKPATGPVPFQWVIRRQFIGTYLDSDVPSYDTRGSQGLRLVELAPGVQHAVGGTHHSMVVELRDALVVFDAPVSDWHSNWVLNALKAKYPGKPVKYLVLTHHHMDHAGGLRAYADQGAALVVGKGGTDHYRLMEGNPHAEGMLFGYVPQARLGFVTDLWSPGAAPLPDKLNPNLQAVVNSVKKAGIAPSKFAGGHGSTADYAPLSALDGK